MNLLSSGKKSHVFVFSLTIFISVAFYLLLELRFYLFGLGPTHVGGKVGKLIDNSIRRSLFDRTSRRRNENFEKSMGYGLPLLAEKGANQVGVHVLLNSWLAHSLLKKKLRQDRAEKYFEQYRYVKSRPDFCAPLNLIRADVGDCFRPIDSFLVASLVNETFSADLSLANDSDAMSFDEEQISHFMRENFSSLYYAIFQGLNHVERLELFGLAFISVFGGIFVSANVKNLSFISGTAPDVRFWIENFPAKCTDKPLMLLHTSVNYDRVLLLASSPNHPKLQCALKSVVNSSGFVDFQSIILRIREATWDTACSSGCCLGNEMPPSRRSDDTFSVMNSDRNGTDRRDVGLSNNRFVVTISEREKNGAVIPRRRNRISYQLQKQHCSAGWFCNRCLRLPFAGTLWACRSVCRSCYAKTICTAPEQTKSTFIDVKVMERQDIKEKRIPRIIHQTWFENVTTYRYPHLQRLQNSWKASGWEYRFYTDSDCIHYIKKNYPVRFVEAYDAILPGAFKADFFRLLVLLKDGGIYADIDVQLEADLDNFITSELSFFIPRDVPLDYWPNSNYCLWNGLMGSSPGHPIVAKAIEDVLSTIQNRLDYNDIERNICSNDINAPIWKMRSLPILILTGPCALGMSVNSAIGQRDILSGHVLGWLNTENVSADHQPTNFYWGDALMLLADRYDLGELRFTDVHRNLLIASSDQDRITKAPLSDGKPKTTNPSTHYSKSESDIVGEHGVYKDDSSLEENVKLVVSLEVLV